MAKLSWTALRDRIEAKVWDASNAIWSTTLIDAVMYDSLKEFSRYIPTIDREILATVAESFDLDVSGILDYLFTNYAEITVDQIPEQKRSVEDRQDGIVRLELDSYRSADTVVYLYVAKPQRITNNDNVTDLVGAIDDADMVEGDEAMVVDELAAAETIPAGTHFKIAGDRTSYWLTSDTVLSSNQGTFNFAPPLQADADEDTVVTLETSTFNVLQEDMFIKLVAGTLAVDYAFKVTNASNDGGVAVPEKIQRWGETYLLKAVASLTSHRFHRDNRRYPTS